MRITLSHTPLLVVLALAASCGIPDNRVYTLYRGSPVDNAIRIHVATFDVNEKENYNKENCEIAQHLFQHQPGISVKYWCEKGRYRN